MAIRDDFTAGEVLAAADLNDTFASKPPFAYGTATPSTTVEGFIWYDENDTPPTAKFWDGSAFENISAPSGLTHIATSDFSAVSTVSLDNVFSAAYSNYAVIMNILTTGVSTASLRFRAAGSDDSTSNYTAMGNRVQAGDIDRMAGTVTTSLALQLGTWQANYNFHRLEIYNPNKNIRTGLTHQNSCIANATSLAAMNITSGQFQTTTVFDGFTIIQSTGNMSGQIRVYGYKDGV